MTEPGPQVRLSDAERQRAVDDLFRAHREGRIELDDLDRRLATVYAARTVGDLSGPLADLPGPRPWSASVPDVERIEASGGLSRTGRWTVSRRTRIEQHTDGGGPVVLDLSVAEVPSDRIEIELLLGVNGRARIVVARGTGVDMSGVRGRGRPNRTDVPTEADAGGLQVVVTGSAGKRSWVRASYPGKLRWWESY